MPLTQTQPHPPPNTPNCPAPHPQPASLCLPPSPAPQSHPLPVSIPQHVLLGSLSSPPSLVVKLEQDLPELSQHSKSSRLKRPPFIVQFVQRGSLASSSQPLAACNSNPTRNCVLSQVAMAPAPVGGIRFYSGYQDCKEQSGSGNVASNGGELLLSGENRKKRRYIQKKNWKGICSIVDRKYHCSPELAEMFDEEEMNHPTVAADECRLWKVLMNKYLMQLKNDKRKQRTQKVKQEVDPLPKTVGNKESKQPRKNNAKTGRKMKECEGEVQQDMTKIQNGVGLKKEENVYPPNLTINSQEDIQVLLSQALLALPPGFPMPFPLQLYHSQPQQEPKIEHPLPSQSD